MIHFRLRRSFRLAVDLLSLNFAGPSYGSRSAYQALRGIHASDSAILSRAGLSALHVLRPPRAIPPYLRSKRQVSVRTRRYLASSGILLALSLEVCGCDPVGDSTLALNPPNGARNVQELARPEQTLSFYAPDESATHPNSSVTFNDPPTDLPPFPPEAKPLPWAIPESVYFIYRGHRRGDRPDDPRPSQPPDATAFVLSVPDRTHSRYARFLVTARHVVDPQWAHCSEQNPVSIDLRLNRRNGGVGFETILLQSGSFRRFYTPSDPTADLAVIPLEDGLIAHLDDYKVLDVPFRLLPTDAELRLITANQQIMTARLSVRPSGELGDYPVFDAGSLSKMPAEPVGVQCGVAQGQQSPAKLLHVWFIDAGVPRGVSGAPVYASIPRGPGAPKTPVLLGIQSVTWPDRGITGITPSTALGDLIQSAFHESKLNLDFYRGPNP